ncbi:MAG TPA: sigma factor, partial [Candidatus Limnocylindria bacterium]
MDIPAENALSTLGIRVELRFAPQYRPGEIQMTDARPWRDLDRARLVRVCAAISGDRQAADDLAQETLQEAWRHRDKLHEPAGFERWLNAIARNVCRRWARQRGRELAAGSLGPEPAVVEPRDG